MTFILQVFMLLEYSRVANLIDHPSALFLKVGDGCGGGGVSLAGTWWDRKALAIADEIAQSFDGEIGIYAFRTLVNGGIQVRIERLTNK